MRLTKPADISGHLEHLWIYLVAPFVGAIVAVLFGDCLNRILKIQQINNRNLMTN